MIVCTAFAMLLVSACGTSEADEIKSTLKSYDAAFVAGDGSKACDLLTDEAKHKIENEEPSASSCPAAVALLSRSTAYAGLVHDLESAGVSGIEVIAEDEAKANVKSGSASHPVELEKPEHDWRISAPPGF